MSAFVAFELSTLGDDDDDVVERKFLVKGLPAADLWSIIGDETGPFFAYIEDVESEPGPRNGTIDQGGSMNKERTESEWSLSSCEIEDRAGFVDQTVAKIKELYGWNLEEVQLNGQD